MSDARTLLLFAVVICLGVQGPACKAEEPTLPAQREEQKKIEMRIAALSRRMASAIDVMTYQRLTPTAEQKMLDNTAKALHDLNDTEIRQALAHLEAAGNASNAATVSKELRVAYQEQRRVVSQLRAVAFRLDPVRNVDDTAGRFARAAERQTALSKEVKKMVSPQESKSPLTPLSEYLADEQADLNSEVSGYLKQLGEISRFLRPEEKSRIEKVGVNDRGEKLIAEMAITLRDVRDGKYDAVHQRQQEHASAMNELASALRGPVSYKVVGNEIAQVIVEAIRDVASNETNPKNREVVLLPETIRDPAMKLEIQNGKIDPRDFEWDIPLTRDGRIMVTYNAQLDKSVRAVSVVYRVIPKEGMGDSASGRITHPRDDKDRAAFNRLRLQKIPLAKEPPGSFVRELGLFEKSRKFDAVELFVIPQDQQANENMTFEVGGRVNFEVGSLKKLSNGSTGKLDSGDAVELCVEVVSTDPAGFTSYSRLIRKTVVTEYEALTVITKQICKGKLADQLREIANDQSQVILGKLP